MLFLNLLLFLPIPGLSYKKLPYHFAQHAGPASRLDSVPAAAEEVDVCVVGGGVGGLVCSSFLAMKGLRVSLLEKNSLFGGRMQSEEIRVNSKNYRFDVGPSLFLLPDIYEKTFKQLGCSLEDYVTLQPVAPLYRCYFDDNTYTEISKDEKQMRECFEAIEPGSFDAYQEYMRHANNFLG